MKKILLFLLPPIFAAITIFTATQIIANQDKGTGGLQVTSTPASTVYLDGKNIGKTPFCKCDLQNMLPTGEHSIKLIPDGSSDTFEQKITIVKSVITVVDRTFAGSTMSQGSIITLSDLKNITAPQIFVTSFPDHAKVYLDKSLSGETPLVLKDVTESDHDLILDKDGYQKKIVRIKATKGYKLSAIVYLGLKNDITASDAAQPQPKADQPLANTPTLTSAIAHITILQTPTGFLRVRADATLGAAEISRVNPGEVYELKDEKEGWLEIKLKDGTFGWISSQYGQKQ